jgi:hypothetical protein
MGPHWCLYHLLCGRENIFILHISDFMVLERWVNYFHPSPVAHNVVIVYCLFENTELTVELAQIETSRLQERYSPWVWCLSCPPNDSCCSLLACQRLPEFFCYPAYTPHLLLFPNHVMNAAFLCLWHSWCISASFKSCTSHRMKLLVYLVVWMFILFHIISVGFSGWWYGGSLRICLTDSAAILPTLYWQHTDKRDTGMQSNTNS